MSDFHIWKVAEISSDFHFVAILAGIGDFEIWKLVEKQDEGAAKARQIGFSDFAD